MNAAGRNFRLQRNQTVEAKDSIIKITPARAIFESPVGILLALEKPFDQVGRFSEKLRRQPGDLEHFKAQAHEAKSERNTPANPVRDKRFSATAIIAS